MSRPCQGWPILSFLAQRIAQRDGDLRAARDEITRFKTEAATFQARVDELARSQTPLEEAFQALSDDALKEQQRAVPPARAH